MIMMGTTYFPIKNITTYTSNWTILGKIIEKSQLKLLKNDNPFLYVDIVDKNGDTIRGKFWGLAANKWNDLLEKGKVYTFSKGSVNLSNKKFNTIPHNYEINFNSDSKIEPSDEVTDIVEERDYDFVTLRDINSTSRATPFVVDMLCIVKSINQSILTNTKYNMETKKRILIVVDDTSYELEVVLWGAMCDLPIFDDILNKAVIVSQATIKDWNNCRSAQTGSSTRIKLAQFKSRKNQERLATLEAWYRQALTNDTFKSMKTQNSTSARDSFELSTIENALSKGKGNYTFNCKLRKVFWKNKDGDLRIWYNACPNCLKKAIEEHDTNVWRCIACDDAIITPVLRYIITTVFVDFTGQLVATVYSDNGKKLLGFTEQELELMDKEKLKNTLDYDILHKDFKVSGFFKNKTYNGETKNTFKIVSIEEIDYVKETETLLEKMQITYDSVENFLSLNKSDLESDRKKIKTEMN